MKSRKTVFLITTMLLLSLSSHAVIRKGIVVSDCASRNTATGENLAADIVNLTEAMRTMYVVEEGDGKGHLIRLATPYGNTLKRGDKIMFDTDDPRIEKIEIVSRDNPLPVKKKHINELNAEDYYTLVALQGVEFRKKEGAYINVDERYVQQSSLNEMLSLEGLAGFRPAREFSDTWATMLVDDQGSHIYCLISSLCEWRRNKRLPQGIGEVVGVVVPGKLDRWGSPLGDFAIRPIFEEDIKIGTEQQTSYKTICAWNYDFNMHGEMDCVKAGKVRFPKPGQIVGDQVKAEHGNGLLWTDTGASLTFDKEANGRHSWDGWKDDRNTGSRSYSALRLDCKAGDWFRSDSGYNGLYIKASLEDIKAKSLHFNFSFIASDESSTYAERFPVEWKVSYSTDGKTFIEIAETYVLRPSCFLNVKHEKKPAIVHIGCAPGFTEHRTDLPLELLGKELTIKIAPCSDKTASLPEKFDGACNEGTIRNDREAGMILRFGDISLTYTE